jgi:hypothetical protein
MTYLPADGFKNKLLDCLKIYGTMGIYSVQLKEHMNEFLSNATAEDLNEMAMAIKEAAPVEQNF